MVCLAQKYSVCAILARKFENNKWQTSFSHFKQSGYFKICEIIPQDLDRDHSLAALKCIPDSPSRYGSVARTLCFYAACSPGAGETPPPHWHPSYTSSNRTARWVWRTSQGLVGYAASLVGCSKGLKQHRKNVRSCEWMELQINGYITKQILQGDEYTLNATGVYVLVSHKKYYCNYFFLEEVNNFIPGCHNFDWKIFCKNKKKNKHVSIIKTLMLKNHHIN